MSPKIIDVVSCNAACWGRDRSGVVLGVRCDNESLINALEIFFMPILHLDFMGGLWIFEITFIILIVIYLLGKSNFCLCCVDYGPSFRFRSISLLVSFRYVRYLYGSFRIACALSQKMVVLRLKITAIRLTRDTMARIVQLSAQFLVR